MATKKKTTTSKKDLEKLISKHTKSPAKKTTTSKKTTTPKTSTPKKEEVKKSSTKKTTIKKTTTKNVSNVTKNKTSSISKTTKNKDDQKKTTKVAAPKKATTKKTTASKTSTKTKTTKKTTTSTKKKEPDKKVVKKTTTKKTEPKKTTKKKTTTKKTPVKKTTTPKKIEVLDKEEDLKLDKPLDIELTFSEPATKPTKGKKKNKVKDLNKPKEKGIKGFILLVWYYICKVVSNIGIFFKKIFKKLYNSLKQKKKKHDELEKEIKEVKIDTTDVVDVKTLNRKERIAYERQLLKTDERSKLVLRKYKNTIPIIGWIFVFLANRFKVMRFDMKRFNKRLKYGTIKDKLLIIFMLLLIVIFSLMIVFCLYIVFTAPKIDEERLYTVNQTILLDKDGVEFARIGNENREKVTYDELPEILVDAIVATEDSRFFQHNGVDMARFTKAAVGQLLGNSDAGGASTLTMQVSKNAATSREAEGIKGIIRKFQDVYLAVFVFEKQFTKEQIMEFYVNIPELGASSVGVQRASQLYFGKDVSDLTLPEAAMIAGLFQAPSAYNPYVYPELAEARRDTVLSLMARHGYITDEQKLAAQEVHVEDMLVGIDTNLSPYIAFIDTLREDVKEKTGFNPMYVGMTIHTTMDRTRQDYVNDIENGKLWKFANDDGQAGIAVIDNHDGSIVAVGAGRNKKTELSLNYATQISKHPGSTAKPVVDYGPAVEYLGWGTGQTIVDMKYTYSGGGYIRNWDNGYRGIETIEMALGQSRNIPALFTFQQVPNDNKAEFTKNLGWTLEDDGNGTLLETNSIGGFTGVSPLQSAAAYAAFARGGTYIEPYTFYSIEYTDTGEVYEHEPKKVQAMSEETAYIVTHMLMYAISSGNIGVGSVSGTDLAAKTGTSTVGQEVINQCGQGSSVIGDAWEVVYSPDYTFSLWYGHNDNTPGHCLTNSEGGTARNGISRLLVQGMMKQNSRFNKPAGVKTATVEMETDPLQLASEYTPDKLRFTGYFKEGTIPSSVSKRFAKLDAPSGLSYTSTSTSVSLSWNAAALPDQKNDEYLKKYFSSSKIFKPWANELYQKRVDYNNGTFGEFGYRIYMNDQEIGFTTSTNYTANIEFNSSAKFSVTASYRNFPSNQSNSISVNVAPNSSNNTGVTGGGSTNQQVTIEKVTTICNSNQGCTYADFVNNLIGGDPASFIYINGSPATQVPGASVTYSTCYGNNNNWSTCTDASTIQENKWNIVYYYITYNGQTYPSQQIVINPN